jgi:inorganic pyrophosphatase/exopolyphosphatase
MQLKPELTLLLLSVSCLFLFVFVCVGCVSCVCVRVFMDDRIELEEIPFYIQAEEEHMEQVDNDRRSNFRQVLSLLRVGLSDTSPS